MTAWTLVTGGAKRLGAEICRTLAAEGHALVIHYHTSQKEAEEVAASCRDLGVSTAILKGDFSTPTSTQEFISRYLAQFSNTAYLVNNVGNFLAKSALKTSPEEFLALYQNNLYTPFILIKALVDSIKKEHGAILNLGIAGLQRADAYSSIYSSAKQGLLALTKALARELAPDQVSVNMVSPGYLDHSVDLPKDPASLPMQRLGSPQEVARLIAYLLHPANRYITGQNIEVAGGVRL